MKVLVFNNQRDLAIKKASVKPIVVDVLDAEGCDTDEVSVYFVTTEEICRLHQEFFGDPAPTDCITFPLDSSEESHYHIFGEIFVCPKTAIDFDATAVDFEITLYIVHGLLHLIGYDDIDAQDVKKMRRAEKEHMERLVAKKLLLKL